MDVKSGDEVVGHVTRYCWSPRLEHNTLINVPTDLSAPGTALSLDAGDGWREAEVVDIPWISAEKVIPPLIRLERDAVYQAETPASRPTRWTDSLQIKVRERFSLRSVYTPIARKIKVDCDNGQTSAGTTIPKPPRSSIAAC